MKVLLLKEVKGLGAAGEIVDAKEGYTANYLIPRKLVTTDLTMKIKPQNDDSIDKKQLEHYVNKIQKVHFEVTKKANEKGILFAHVSEEEVKELIQKRFPELNMQKISMKLNPKELPKMIGNFSINAIFGDQKIVIKLNVSAENLKKLS